MSDYYIQVKVVHGQIIYIDEGGNQGPNKIVKSGKTIHWISDDYDLEIRDFTPSDPFDHSAGHPAPPPPFTSKAGHPTQDGTLGTYNKGEKFKYTVIVTDPNKGKSLPPDDPTIMFSDGLSEKEAAEDLNLLSGSLDTLGDAAKAALSGVIEQMKQNGGLARNPNALLYPGGINTITVSAGLSANLNLTITISGPPPTALFPPPPND